jgi:hypothetical protein
LPVAVSVQEKGQETVLSVKPERAGSDSTDWSEYSWEKAKEEIRAEARVRCTSFG